MKNRKKEIRRIASELLVGMLANPHIYAMISDESGKGQQEQILISNAISMAESLIQKIEQLPENQS